MAKEISLAKIGSPFTYSILAIAFSLASIIAQSLGDLVILRHPRTVDSTIDTLTCISEDDGSALIWNYEGKRILSNVDLDVLDFRPKNPNSTRRMTQWDKKSAGWEVVNSAIRPMGPVFDYRWEGFKEYTSDGYEKDAEDQYVQRMKGSSGMVVFSVRARYKVHITLCSDEDPAAGPCIKIVMGLKGKQSVIRRCSGLSRNLSSAESEHCEDVANFTHEFWVIGPIEWRTFRIDWESKKNMIEVFNSTDSEPFLKANLGFPIPPVFNVSVAVKSSHVRFHFYDYFRTEKNGSVLYTKDLPPHEEHFCVDLLIGLCRNCELQIDLIDRYDKNIQTRYIRGNESLVKNGVPSWRWINVTATRQSPKVVRLRILTILRGVGAGGWWAVDVFRTCKSGGSPRESTITIDYSKRIKTSPWAVLTCQKLSYTESARIDPEHPSPMFADMNRSHELLNKSWVKSCNGSSSCANFGRKWLICNPSGCACDRGYRGASNCAEECTDGTYGYGCYEKCGSCSSGACNKKDGYCASGCEAERFQPPLCKIETVLTIRGEQLVWLAIIPAIAICLMVIILIVSCAGKRSKVRGEPHQPSYLELISSSLTEPSTSYPATLALAEPAMPQSDAESSRLSMQESYDEPKEADSCIVSVGYFETHAKNAVSSGLLHSQFMLLRMGLTRSCEYGQLPENMPKNMHRDVIPYDDTRVILEKIPGDPSSDYINASYIKGYKKDDAYIAAQGPKSNTVIDFWRMIWQEEVRVICMLTNVIEGEEVQCAKYWPDIGAKIEYGDLIISNTDDQVFADYTFRTFELSYRGAKREITHLHYTEWPNLGVPMYPQPLIAYMKKLKETPPGNGPIVVHCSTGDDRTGTMILCDICLRQAAAEKEVNVTAVVTRMRDSHTNMVGTLQQYILAHIIITESLMSRSTQIPCSEVPSSRMDEMRMHLPSDIQRLTDAVWQAEALKSSGQRRGQSIHEGSPITTRRKECPVIYSNMCEISGQVESGSGRFDAVSVTGVRAKKQYLASRLPSPSILSDFWGFVAEKSIKLILILQYSDPEDPTCCDIIPDERFVGQVPKMMVKNRTSLEDEEYLSNEEILLTHASEEGEKTESVTVLTCRGWARAEHGRSPTPATLVSLWMASEKIQRREGQTLVLCDDGVTGCGLYLALSFLLERMAVEGECDVISAVRAVRLSDPEFVNSQEKFEFLYDAAVNYVEYFQTYANFC